jgi:uncharacterized protein YdcH (DUF465 family)
VGSSLASLEIPRHITKEVRTMETQNPDSLTEIDPEYRRLHAEHRDHENRLEALAGKPRLSEEEQLEEKRLKKEKLLLKDRMEAIARTYRIGVAH